MSPFIRDKENAKTAETKGERITPTIIRATLFDRRP
jgi:hypothetical protein